MTFTVDGPRYRLRPGATGAMFYLLEGGPGHGTDGTLPCHTPEINWDRRGVTARYAATGRQDPTTSKWLYQLIPEE